MLPNRNPPKIKGDFHISNALRQYAHSHLDSNNPRFNTSSETKIIYTVPKLQTPKNQPTNKQIYTKYNNYRQNNEQTKYTKYKQNTERITGHRAINKNHSFFESKNNKTDIKKYPPRSSNTYKQPESRNLRDNYREKKQSDNNININLNNTNNIKRKYETTSYEHPGRRKNKYENKSYEGEKYPPKYYRNNPHIYNNNLNNNNPILTSNTLVAQKICNIAIKGGGSSNIEKESINISGNNRRPNRQRMIEYEVEEDNLRYNYNNEEEIEEDSINNNDDIGNNKTKLLKKIKRKKIPKKKNYTPIIEMQKAQSFEQPRDFNFMPKQKNTKPKFVIGIDDSNFSTNKNYIKNDKAKNECLKTDDNKYKNKNINININNINNTND